VAYVGGKATAEIPFPYRVSRTELEVFDIFAFTPQHYVEWRLRLTYTDDEGEGTFVIDDDGQPFQTTASGGSEPLPGQHPVLLAQWRMGRLKRWRLPDSRVRTMRRGAGRKVIPRPTLPTPRRSLTLCQSAPGA
jgi:hypothetical protein